MKRMELGKNREQSQGIKAFIPHPFPPKEGFDWDANLLKKADQATRLLGKLARLPQLGLVFQKSRLKNSYNSLILRGATYRKRL